MRALPAEEMTTQGNSHNLGIGYLLWIFGFMGAHRFYYGRPVSGTIWFFTLGLFLIGWIIDLFLIPSMDRTADRDFPEGPHSYNVSWILLTFLGVFGIHRFYLGKWLTGLVYLLTLGLFGLGIIYDYWTLNGQIREVNSVAHGRAGPA
jgi:TM2 domain-containing membrane protein YozV